MLANTPADALALDQLDESKPPRMPRWRRTLAITTRLLRR